MKPTVTITSLSLLLFLVGCGADPAYESPEKAAMTYVEYGPNLKNAVDIPAWNFVWNGTSKSAQEWFLANWEAICDRPSYRQACGDQTNPEKQKMVAFGAAIAPRGPSRGDKVKDVKVDGTTAEATFERWDGTMRLVKEGRNWKVDGLFGVPDLASNEW